MILVARYFHVAQLMPVYITGTGITHVRGFKMPPLEDRFKLARETFRCVLALYQPMIHMCVMRLSVSWCHFQQCSLESQQNVIQGMHKLQANGTDFQCCMVGKVREQRVCLWLCWAVWNWWTGLLDWNTGMA